MSLEAMAEAIEEAGALTESGLRKLEDYCVPGHWGLLDARRGFDLLLSRARARACLDTLRTSGQLGPRRRSGPPDQGAP